MTIDHDAAVAALTTINAAYPAMTCDEQAAHRAGLTAAADAIIGAGFTLNAVLTTATELDAQTPGTLILVPTLIAAKPTVFERARGGWATMERFTPAADSITSEKLISNAADHKVTVVFVPQTAGQR